jgi:hypothetical protein
VVEALDSLQWILFPFSTDEKSFHLLNKMISQLGFDPDSRKFEGVEIRDDPGEDIPYYYFADRLSALFAELANPTPRTWLDKRMARRSSERNKTLLAYLGIIVAVIFSSAALVVTSYQTWVSYQAWQHPVVSPAGPLSETAVSG